MELRIALELEILNKLKAMEVGNDVFSDISLLWSVEELN